MTSETPPESTDVVDCPPDKWHPIYDSVKAFLESEAKEPAPGTPPIRRRRKRR